jgi:hypothetical protein
MDHFWRVAVRRERLKRFVPNDIKTILEPLTPSLLQAMCEFLLQFETLHQSFSADTAAKANKATKKDREFISERLDRMNRAQSFSENLLTALEEISRERQLNFGRGRVFRFVSANHENSSNGISKVRFFYLHKGQSYHANDLQNLADIWVDVLGGSA